MYYNKSYLGKTSYSTVSDIGKYASGVALCLLVRIDDVRNAIQQ